MATAYVDVVTSDDEALRWEAISSTDQHRRYRRGFNAVRFAISQVIGDMVTAFPQTSPHQVSFDNEERSTSFSTPILSTSQPVDTRAIVSIQWESAARRGTSARIASAPGASRSAYRFSGVARIVLLSKRQAGDGIIAELATYLAGRLRWLQFGTNNEMRFTTPSIERGDRVSALSTSPGQSGHELHARTLSIPFFLDESNARLPSAIALSTSGADVDVIGEICRDRFRTLVQVPNGYLVQYDNLPSVLNPFQAIMLFVSILHAETGLRSNGVDGPGSPRYSTSGIMQIDIDVPLFSGLAAAMEIADNIFDNFHDVADRGVTFSSASIIATTRVGSSWRVIVDVPFEAEQRA